MQRLKKRSRFTTKELFHKFTVSSPNESYETGGGFNILWNRLRYNGDTMAIKEYLHIASSENAPLPNDNERLENPQGAAFFFYTPGKWSNGFARNPAWYGADLANIIPSRVKVECAPIEDFNLKGPDPEGVAYWGDSRFRGKAYDRFVVPILDMKQLIAAWHSADLDTFKPTCAKEAENNSEKLAEQNLRAKRNIQIGLRLYCQQEMARIRERAGKAERAKANRGWMVRGLRNDLAEFDQAIRTLRGHFDGRLYDALKPSAVIEGDRWDWDFKDKLPSEMVELPSEEWEPKPSKPRADGWCYRDVTIREILTKRKADWTEFKNDLLTEYRQWIEANKDQHARDLANILKEEEARFDANPTGYVWGVPLSGDQRASLITYDERTSPLAIWYYERTGKTKSDWLSDWKITHLSKQIWSRDEDKKIAVRVTDKTWERYANSTMPGNWEFRLEWNHYGSSMGDTRGSRLCDWIYVASRTNETRGAILTSQSVRHAPESARRLKTIGVRLLNKENPDQANSNIAYAMSVVEDKMLGKCLVIGCHKFTEDHFRRAAAKWDKVMKEAELDPNSPANDPIAL